VLLCAATSALGQAFPSKPVTLIVPWPAGGSTDIYFRKLATSRSATLGQNLVIENRPGGSRQQRADDDGEDGAARWLHDLAAHDLRVPCAAHAEGDWNPVTDFTYIIGLAATRSAWW